MKNVRLVVVATFLTGVFFATGSFLGCAPGVGVGPETAATPAGPTQVAVLVPSQPGAVVGTSQNSDEFIWRLFIQFAAPASPSQPSPVVFETWASDADTFSLTPKWPSADAPRRFQRSALGAASTPAHGGAIDVLCNPPGTATVGKFPTSGTPTPCIAEEVKRNRPQYDYIVSNGLNTKVGLSAAYAKSFKVTMPTDAISVKGDWVPVQMMIRWIPELKDVDGVRKYYYTTTSDSVEYALTALHVSSRQNPNWVWGTFEHQLTPGRCDDLGCWDTFGAQAPAVKPNRMDINTRYGPCPKTPALQTLMTTAKLSPVWENYCLKATQVDYTAPDGTPYALGSSVIERLAGGGTVAASSCIACHVYASFGSSGTPTPAAFAILPYNPTGRPIPAVLEGSLQFDFMWGVVNAAPTPTPAP